MDLSSTPLVSVRIPSYNHGDYIRACLDSVANDNYPNKELVIMDDGSHDNTLEEINLWRKNNCPHFPVRIYTRPHRGICGTLNELIYKCKGKYLVSLASDDELAPGGIESRVNYLESNPQKSAVISDCFVINKKGQVIFESALSDMYNSDPSSYKKDNLLYKEIILNWSIPGPALMVKKSIYDQIGLYNENLPIEDWDFYLRMVSKNLIGFVDDKVAYYRVHDANTCGKQNAASSTKTLIKTALLNYRQMNPAGKYFLTQKITLLIFSYFKHALKKIR